MRTCPNCNSKIDENEIQCPECGVVLCQLYCTRCKQPLDLRYGYCLSCQQAYSLPYKRSFEMQPNKNQRTSRRVDHTRHSSLQNDNRPSHVFDIRNTNSNNHQLYSASIDDCKIESRINFVAVFAVIMFGFFAYETISWLLNPPSAYTGGFVGTYFLLGMWVVFIFYFMAHITIKYRILPCPYCNTPHNVALKSVGFVCSACGKRIAIIEGKIRKAEELE